MDELKDKKQALKALEDLVYYKKIQDFVLSHLHHSPGSRIHRGHTNKYISSQLNLPHNPRFSRMLNLVINQIPHNKILVDGARYYKGIDFIHGIPESVKYLKRK